MRADTDSPSPWPAGAGLSLSRGGEREYSPHPSSLAGEGGAQAAGLGGRGVVPRKDELRKRAKAMRREPTDAERRLWSILRAHRFAGYKFKRQVPIDSYIADFVCLARRLIVEADGSQHAESGYDERRDAYLRAQGFRVLRFWNNDVLLNAEGVAAAILDALSPLPPAAARRAPPSPARGEGL